MWNPFKKSASGKQQVVSGQGTKSGKGTDTSVEQPQNMGMLQKLAMKKLMSMSESERKQLMDKFMTPDNLSKNKDKIIAQMEQMKKSGMITETQYKEGKKRLGI